MRPNWPVKKLREVCVLISRGKTPKYGNGSSFAIKSAQVYEPLRLNNCQSIIDEFAELNKSYALKKDDILLNGTGTGTLGRSSFVYEELKNTYIPDSHINLIRTDKTKALPFFIYSWLNSRKGLQAINASYTGSTNQIELSASSIKNFTLPLPNLKIQQKIVERLDAIRKAQELCDQQIQKTEELFESMLREIFEIVGNSNFVSLSEVAKVAGGYAFKSGDFINYGIQVIKIGNVKKGNLDIEMNPTFLPENFADRYRNYLLKKGDILISMTGTVGKEDYGNVARVEIDKPMFLNQRVGKFVINDNILISGFLYYFGLSKKFRSEVFKLGKGLRQANISGLQIESIKIPLPKIKEQQKIVEKLEAVQNYKKLLLKQKAYFKELFDSILNKLMKGDLDS